MIKLRVLHKGLIFLLVSVVLISVFFVQLLQLVNESDQLVESDVRLTQTLDILDATANEFLYALNSFGEQLWGSRSVTPQGQEAQLERIRSHLNEARPLAKTDPVASKLYDDAVQLVSELDELWKIRAPADAPNSTGDSSFQQFARRLPAWRKLLAKYTLQKRTLIEQKRRLDLARIKEKVVADKLKRQIELGITCSIVFLVIITIIFLKDITNRLAALVVNARRLPTGEPLTARVSGTDELAYLDDVLHRAQQQLFDAAEHRKSLMEMVAHDLRSPLMSSKLSLDLLLTSKRSSTIEDESSRISSIKDNHNRLIGLLEDLLTIDQLEAGKLKLDLDSVDIKSLIDASFQSVQSLAVSKDVVLLNESTSALADCDGPRVVQVLSNLLTNAIQHAPAQSTVRIQTVIVGQQLRQQLIKVLVVDAGPGIAAEKRAGLFQKFSQLDRKSGNQGFGLGLAICRLIVTEHGGTIGVENNADSGASFWFTVPLEGDS